MSSNGIALLATVVVIGVGGGVLFLNADEKKSSAPATKKTTEVKHSPSKTTTSTPAKPVEKPKKIVKTDAEWRKLLTPEQYRITRLAGTERAYGEAYAKFKKQGEGTYFCVCCDAELFTSKQKFNSGCGWPSFYDPSKAVNITEHQDTSAGMVRTEVVCTQCDAHLGHVFFGEGFNTPTDKRYCINAAAMRFQAKGAKKDAKKAKDGTDGAVEVKTEKDE